MNEDDLIGLLAARQSARRPDVRLGIGDDGAVVTVPRDSELVIVTDTLVEGTHFPAHTPAAAIGHRCLAVNLSDIAAMGAAPAWASLSLSLPAADAKWMGEFADAFFALADEHGVALIGGDTVRGARVITVTLHGIVSRGRSLSRGGARPGDRIFVTGTLGDAAEGCRRFCADAAAEVGETFVRSFLYPQPRLSIGRQLAGVASAAIDISDGLATDLERLTAASGVGASVDVGSLPVSGDLVAACGRSVALDTALTGGDDYELCFTVPVDACSELNELMEGWQVPVVCIGAIDSERVVRWTLDGEAIRPGQAFRHF